MPCPSSGICPTYNIADGAFCNPASNDECKNGKPCSSKSLCPTLDIADGGNCDASIGDTCKSGEACDNNKCPAAPPVVGTWVTDDWGVCSVTCGIGSQTRTVTCKDPNGKELNDNSCADRKPDTMQQCNAGACPPGVPTPPPPVIINNGGGGGGGGGGGSSSSSSDAAATTRVSAYDLLLLMTCSAVLLFT